MKIKFSKIEQLAWQVINDQCQEAYKRATDKAVAQMLEVLEEHGIKKFPSKFKYDAKIGELEIEDETA